MDNLKLKILEAGFTKALRNKHVFQGLANNSFTGKINQKGDKVVMDQVSPITVNSYAGTTITVQNLFTAQREIIADQDKYWAFQLDTLEYNNLKNNIISEGMDNAAYAVNDAVDTYLAGLYEQAGLTISGNTAAACIDLTSLNVEDTFLNMAEVFAVAGVPRSMRKFAVVPPWVTTKMALAGISAKTDNTELYSMGYIGTALGWDFLESPNVHKNSASWDISKIFCGVYGQSFGYASAVSTIETTQAEALVGVTKVKGRVVFGGKVVRPDMTGVIYADKTAEA